MSEELLELPEVMIGDSIRVDEIAGVTARLTEVLEQESEYLKTMQIRKVGELQDEKIRLISWLEAQKKLIAMRPDLTENFTDEERDDMAEVVERFTKAVERNFHQSSIARAVNERVVQAVTESMQSREHVNTYTADGINSQAAKKPSVAFNLNQKA